jgi:hypothetical protein
MRILGFGLFVLLVLGAAWSAAWSYAAHEAGMGFDAWLKSEAARGREWTCPNRAIGGYPLAVTVACTQPTFLGRAPGQTVRVQMAGLTAEAAVTHPRRIVVGLQAPLTYATSDGAAVLKARWSSLSLDLDGLPDIRSAEVHGRDLSVDGQFAGAGPQGGTAAGLDATFAQGSPERDAVLDFTVAITKADSAPIDDLFGGRQSADLDLAGTLDHIDVGDVRTPEEAMEVWRQAGGRVDLRPSHFSRGDSGVTGAGTLGLDDAHRPQGRLQASFVGLEPVLRRYGIDPNVAAAGSLLSTLFGGGQPPPSTAPPGTLSLPISFQNGRLGIGPIRTPVEVPPLY